MSIGIWQLVLILVIIFTLFGAGKLPGVMGDVGKGLKNLKDGIKGNNNTTSENTGNKPDAQ